MLVIDDINNEAINNNITEQQRIKLDVIVATYQKKYDQNEMMIMLNKIQATRASNTEISDFTHLMRQYLLTQWVNQLAE
jgi:predicted HTH domain antitoxin